MFLVGSLLAASLLRHESIDAETTEDAGCLVGFFIKRRRPKRFSSKLVRKLVDWFANFLKPRAALGFGFLPYRGFAGLLGCHCGEEVLQWTVRIGLSVCRRLYTCNNLRPHDGCRAAQECTRNLYWLCVLWVDNTCMLAGGWQRCQWRLTVAKRNNLEPVFGRF